MSDQQDLMNINVQEITTPNIIQIMKDIKKIQARVKEPENFCLDYAYLHNKMADEFPKFLQEHPTIFVKVLRGDDLSIVAAVLYYKDKIAKGELTEEEFADRLATRFLPSQLKEESDKRLKEMKKKK